LASVNHLFPDFLYTLYPMYSIETPTHALPSAFRSGCRILFILAISLISASAGLPKLRAEVLRLDLSETGKGQIIDGFGNCISGDESKQEWWRDHFIDTMGASILRVDLVPRFKTPWSDYNYYSPWFSGKGNEPFAFNYETTEGDVPRYYEGVPQKEFYEQNGNRFYNGPEGNRARTYTSATDYTRTFGGKQAPIAVMGPDINDNIDRYFQVEAGPAPMIRAIMGSIHLQPELKSRFKLIGSIWSPMPWIKISSGNQVGDNYGFWPFAESGTPYPYISGGNFVGGKLDVSETPMKEFDDAALPADLNGPNADEPRGATSALTQFARATVAYLRAIQNATGSRFYAISIQNELNFETFYNSCTYPLSSQYIKALKYVRRELDKYADLRGILIMGPEDLLAGSDWGLWQYGGNAGPIHKNLQYLQEISNDPEADQALSFFCIHGYAEDGVSASGADPVAWKRWADGWSSAPKGGLPAQVRGFKDYGKKSWMTETSGENPSWIWPKEGFPKDGAFSIAIKIHQALTTGGQSAWVYWQFSDGKAVAPETLTDSSLKDQSPKLTAVRHFSKYIRPGATRIRTLIEADDGKVLSSAYVNEDASIVIVLINTDSEPQHIRFSRIDYPFMQDWDAVWIRSDENQLWKLETLLSEPTYDLLLHGYSVNTLVLSNSSASSNPNSLSDWIPLFRLKHSGDERYLFTANSAEKNTLLNLQQQGVWDDQGVSHFVLQQPIEYALPVYRLFNRASGSHFYTMSNEEMETLLSASGTRFVLEGAAFYATRQQVEDTLPVYRFLAPQTGSHFFTISESEKSQIINASAGNLQYEGIAWWGRP